MKLTDRTELNEAPALGDIVHLVDISDKTDGASGTSVKITLENLRKLISNVGFFDYNDAATSVTPISVTAATSPVKITNDGAGTYTLKTYKPDGVTDVWDTTNNVFDWTELSIGDMVDIRLDISVTTTANNEVLNIDLRLAEGTAAEYTLGIYENGFKSAGTYSVVVATNLYMGNIETLNNPGYFEISSDSDASVVVNGWYCKINKR